MTFTSHHDAPAAFSGFDADARWHRHPPRANKTRQNATSQFSYCVKI